MTNNVIEEIEIEPNYLASGPRQRSEHSSADRWEFYLFAFRIRRFPKSTRRKRYIHVLHARTRREALLQLTRFLHRRGVRVVADWETTRKWRQLSEPLKSKLKAEGA